MMPCSSLPPEIARVLARGGTIVTGNQRAARSLRLVFDRENRALGRTFWQPPSIFAWETWTAQLWQQALLAGSSDRLLLNSTQELHIWRAVISADARHTSLQTVESLAETAMEAWQLLCAYRGQPQLKNLGVSGDTRTFQRWAMAFSQRCRSDSYLSHAELENALLPLMRGMVVSELFLVGFDRKTPAQAALVNAFREAGRLVGESNFTTPTGQIFLSVSDTLEEELTDTAGRVRRLIKERAETRIAVIHPEIAADRTEIERAFRRVLAPHLNSIVSSSSAPYEFSLGKPLSEAPMVATAMLVLRLAAGPLSLEDLSRLLLSPWFTPRSEINFRAEFDARDIRNSTLLHPQLGLHRVLQLAQSSSDRTSRFPNLIRQLQTLERIRERHLSEAAKQKPFADWADIMRDFLRGAEWATFDRDTSADFQTRRKWEAALDDLATLDFEGTRPTFSETLHTLQGILDRTLFAPESRNAPVQIMSPLEAAGSQFDAVFFLRCSDLSWPKRPSANPLLGWKLQHELGMPGSDPALDAEYAQTVTDRLAASAPHVVFSYARQTQDSHQRPSPVLAGLGIERIEATPTRKEVSIVSLEAVREAEGIPLRNARIRGGSTVIKDQAACGFRAFAASRLASRPLRRQVPGLDAGERGSLMHAVMARLWEELRSQSALCALSLSERRGTVDRAITRALEDSGAARLPMDSAWDPAYLDVQRERLHRLIYLWLDEEAKRAPFEIKAIEQRFAGVRFGPLELDIRVDRVDTLLDSEGEPMGEILLDYKTGDAKPTAWQTNRPDDPQLPLYAALSEPGVLAGVGFVRLRPGDGGLLGYVNEEGSLPNAKIPEIGSLEEQIEEWRRVLTALAEDFANGTARLNPKSYPSTCQFCDQRILCRIDPAEREADSSENDDETVTTTEESYG